MFDNIDSSVLYFLYTGIAVLVTAFFTFFWKKNIGLVLLTLGALLLALFTAQLDPFLHVWDEQQHALVAKNMMTHPFKPMLYKEPLLPYLKSYWVQNHVWLHKQPLFLWQMAFSMKLFGTNILAVRLPSIIMFGLMPLITYRIGTIIKNEMAGFIAAFFMAMAYFPLELVAGKMATDHNDMSFLFYVSLSFLCWFEFQRTGKQKWLILLGVASGCAVLVKWLMGLLVYVIWFLVLSTINNFRVWEIRNYFVLIKPFAVSMLVFLPWQIYCFVRFPEEWLWEMQAAGKHFNSVIEGHGGDWTYHFQEGMEFLYAGSLIAPFLLLIFVAVSIFRTNTRQQGFFIGFAIVFVYLFFTLAATKMLAFTVIVMPLILISLGILIDELHKLLAKKIKWKTLVSAAIFLIIAFPAFKFLNLEKMSISHSNEGFWYDYERVHEMNELHMITELREEYGDDNIVVFNSNTTVLGSVQIMFFTNYIAYPQIPDDREIKIILENNYTPVVLDRGNLSDSTLTDSRVKIFPVTKIY